MKRRELLAGIAGVAAAAAGARAASPPAPSRLEAVAFDAFPIFDPRPIAARAESLLPGRGAALMEAWRTRQFEYQWLRALSGTYADFWQTTADALDFAAERLGLALGAARGQLLQSYLELAPWPDVEPALQALRARGLRLAFLSNATPAILEAGLRRADLGRFFERALSTDAVRTYKPDPRAYRLGTDALRLAREQILFVAFAGWDAAGAKAFGYPTFWVNRLGLPAERLGAAADGAGRGLADLVAFVQRGALRA